MWKVLIIPTVQMRKLRHKAVREFAQGHTAGSRAGLQTQAVRLHSCSRD